MRFSLICLSIITLIGVLSFNEAAIKDLFGSPASPSSSREACFQAGGQVYEVGTAGNRCIFVNMPANAQDAQDSMRKAFKYE